LDARATNRSEDPGRSQRRIVVLFVLVLAAISLVARWVAVFTEAINWDEFALLARSDVTWRFGQVMGGGRPGLVTIGLMPFVKDCTDSVQAVVNARILWQFMTLAYLAGVYFLVKRWFAFARQSSDGRVEAVLATALLAFLPAFVTWSIQVRTDQAALAFAVWGGVFAMTPGAVPAAIAGMLFAAGLLCSQKAVYVVGLVCVLYLTAALSRARTARTSIGRELRAALLRAGLVAAAGAATLGLYFALVPESAKVMSAGHVAASLDTMSWYRARLGYRAYTVHAARLWVHWLLLAALTAWTVQAWIKRDEAAAARLITCWAVLALGVAVAIFHGSRLPYFLMTAGLFPAIALGIAAGPTVQLAGERKTLAVAGLVALLVVGSAPETREILQGTQTLQRATMQLIHNGELAGMRGYQVERALFCAADPEPIREMFAPQIAKFRQSGPRAHEAFIEEFRRRPIAYIVESYRMGQFPPSVQQFWEAHYVPYSASLLVAGFRIPRGSKDLPVEVLVAGEYRWKASAYPPEGSVRIDEVTVRSGETVWLDAGTHRVFPTDPRSFGTLVLALPRTPMGQMFPFYDPRQVAQIRSQQ
jgi:hypothetical protein